MCQEQEELRRKLTSLTGAGIIADAILAALSTHEASRLPIQRELLQQHGEAIRKALSQP